jgi:hypothetical protein
MNAMPYSFITILLLFSLTTHAEKAKIIATVDTHIYAYSQEILRNKTPQNITNFSGQNSQREVVEFILVQKALALGGLDLQFTFVTGNYDARNIKLLQQGKLLISFDTIWLSYASTLQDDVYISDPVIRKGEYLAAIYIAKHSKKDIEITKIEDLKKFSIVSSKYWPVDWKTISELKPKNIVHKNDWLTMAKLVSLGWIDLLISPFTPNPPYELEGKNYKLVAIDGIKVALNDSRHFVISKKHPYGEQAFVALQKGLKILRRQGVIEKAYQQSGFFNQQVENWTVINKELLDK